MDVGDLHDSGPTIQVENLPANTVRWWRDPEGYGVIATESGDAWLTSFVIQAGDGYRTVRDGQILSEVQLEPARPGRLPNVTLAVP